MRAVRRPSPEGTRLLFAGTVSPMICLRGGPTKGRHDKIRRKAREKKKRNEKRKKRAATQNSKNKQVCLCPAGGARTTQTTRGNSDIEGQNKNNNHKQEKQTSLKTKQTRT